MPFTYQISADVKLFGQEEIITLRRDSEKPFLIEYHGAYKIEKANLTDSIFTDDIKKYLPDSVTITDVVVDTNNKHYEFGLKVEKPLAVLSEVGLGKIDEIITFESISIFVSKDGKKKIDTEQSRRTAESKATAERKEAFHTIDKNNSGTISFTEWYKYFGPIIKTTSNMTKKDLQMMFKAYDEAGSSRGVDFEEYTAFMNDVFGNS